MKDSDSRGAAGMIKQHMHRAFMYLSHALAAQAVYFSLLLNVPAFNVTEISSWSRKYEGDKKKAAITVNTLKQRRKC
jgi:hypothetical protein